MKHKIQYAGVLSGPDPLTRYTREDLDLAIQHYRTVRSRENRSAVDSIALGLFMDGKLSPEELRIITG